MTPIQLSESSKSQPPGSTDVPEPVEILEGLPQYAYPISRYIDLEGIGLDDGFGYSVTITGPPAPRRRRLRRGLATPGPQHSDVEAGKHDDDGPQKLQIERTNEYSVDETYRAI